jgi:hypothetical protein
VWKKKDLVSANVFVDISVWYSPGPYSIRRVLGMALRSYRVVDISDMYVEILKATYGDTCVRTDVRKELETAMHAIFLQKRVFDFSDGNHSPDKLFGDPCPGLPKVLEVDISYAIDGGLVSVHKLKLTECGGSWAETKNNTIPHPYYSHHMSKHSHCHIHPAPTPPSPKRPKTSLATETKHSTPTRRLYIVYHICTSANWETMVADQVAAIVKSELYENCVNVFVSIVGPHALQWKPPESIGAKTVVCYRSSNTTDCERTAIRIIQREIRADRDAYCLYIHTEGVTESNADTVASWHKCMTHVVIDQYETCIRVLKAGYDTCGVNWQPFIFPTRARYGGNFWWARGDYLKKLRTATPSSCHHTPGLWIGYARPNAWSLHNTIIADYDASFVQSEYELKLTLPLSELAKGTWDHREGKGKLCTWRIENKKKETSPLSTERDARKQMTTLSYGAMASFVDITSHIIKKCESEPTQTIRVPVEDGARCAYFNAGDPCVGTTKRVMIAHDDGRWQTFSIAEHFYASLRHGRLTVGVTATIAEGQEVVDAKQILERKWFDCNTDPASKLMAVHANLKLAGCVWTDECPVQRMIVQHVDRNSKVLELGASVGRNALVIATVLDVQKNLVIVESDPGSTRILVSNRDVNGYEFWIEPCSLSSRKLVRKERNVTLSEHETKSTSGGAAELPPSKVSSRREEEEEEKERDWKPVPTITWKSLQEKYATTFDTLVVDCEGVLYWILIDVPHLLDHMRTVIVENDYADIDHKRFVDRAFRAANLTRIHAEGGGHGPCEKFFFEVWKRI